MKMTNPGTLIIAESGIDVTDFNWDCEGDGFDPEQMRACLIEWATRQLSEQSFADYEMVKTGRTTFTIGVEKYKQ